ncbi:hypothetical protein ACFL4F_00070 [Candidatus Margulisiibacteriota bacterium]
MLTGKERAAMLLSLLGSKHSEGVLDHLPPDVSDSIAKALTKTKKKPSTAEISEIVSEADKYAATESPSAAPAGPKGIGEASPPVELITRSSPSKLARALKGERPEFIAFILSHLPVESIYDTLSLLGDVRKEVEEKLLHMKDVPIAEVFQTQVLDIVAKRLRSM